MRTLPFCRGLDLALSLATNAACGSPPPEPRDGADQGSGEPQAKRICLPALDPTRQLASLSAPKGPSSPRLHCTYRQAHFEGCPVLVPDSTVTPSQTQPEEGLFSHGLDEAAAQTFPPAKENYRPGWAPFVARKNVPVLQGVLEDFACVPSFLVADAAGCVLPLTSKLEEGVSYRLWVPNGASKPEALLAPLNILAQCWPRFPVCLPSVKRRALLREQGICLADDQVSFALTFIAGCGDSLRVLEPLLLLKCLHEGCADPLRELVPAMTRGCTVITCLPLQGHWVSFAWSFLGGKIQAWVSMPGPFLAEQISELQWLWGQASGLSRRAFDFREGPLRPPAPGLCGHYAIADLCCHVLGRPFQSDLAALCIASTIAASFEMSMSGDRLVQAPLFLASGAGDLIEQGLASLLKDRGVPPEKVAARAAQAVQSLGLGPIQSAMCSPNAWRCLKQLGNNITPPFQFVLPDELAKVVQARSLTDPPSRRQKKKHRDADAGTGPPKQIPVTPQVDQVLFWLILSTAPYLRLARPVSSKALALVILGDPDLTEAAAQVETVRFRAELIATSEPLLLRGALAQIGDKWCERHVPNTMTPLLSLKAGIGNSSARTSSLAQPARLLCSTS